MDPFAGGAATIAVARRVGRQSGGFAIHRQFVAAAVHRVAADIADDIPGQLMSARLR